MEVDRLVETAWRRKEAGDLGGCLEALLAAARVAPDDLAVMRGLASTLHDAGRFDEMIEICLRGCRVHPEQDVFPNFLFYVLMRTRDANAINHFLREWCLAFTGASDIDGAVAKLAGPAPPPHPLYRNLSMLFLHLGLGEQAVETGTLACTQLGEGEGALDHALIKAAHERIIGKYDGNSLHRGIAQRVARMATKLSPGPARVLDLCCGTGLVGVFLKETGRTEDLLTGIDMVPAMLEKARATGAYDRLYETEIFDFLGGEGESYHLATMADALMYFPSVLPVMAALAPRLVPGGHVVVSTDPCSDAMKVGRRGQAEYAHSRAHLAESARAAGLEVVGVEIAEHRAYPGLYATFRKPGK